MDVKKQERNCVWLVNKFLVNGAKSMSLSSMWGHAWSTPQNLPYQLHNKIRNLVHTECINESKLPSINESKKYCPKSTKLWCNSCTFIVISQMLINYNVCFFWQKNVMVTHTHTHTHIHNWAIHRMTIVEQVVFIFVHLYPNTRNIGLKLSRLLQIPRSHALTMDWIKAHNHFKLSNPVP
jgi:hypothetical protein